jgi:hypothetical protein
MKFLGFRKIKESDYTLFKNDWLEFCTGFRKLNFVIAPAGYFDNRGHVRFSTIWGQWYIKIPFIKSKYDECDPPGYGFYFYSHESWWPNTFVWCWRRKTHHFEMPWALNWYRTSILRKDGKWENEFQPTRLGQKNKEFWNAQKWEGIFWQETYPYTYVLKNGEVQEVLATVKVEEREWRRKWLMRIPLFNLVRRSIDIDFSEELGERRGSWKGGTLGCGWDLKKGEDPLIALRKMEAKRKFN